MRLNELTISTLKSVYVKEYLRKIEHTFTLEDMVTIILNSDLALSTKINILNRFKVADEIEGYTCNNYDELLKEIECIISDIVYAQQCLCGGYSSILTYEDKYDRMHCALSIDTIRSIMRENEDDCKSIIVIDGLNGEESIYIDLDDSLNPIRIYLLKNSCRYISSLYDKYVDIPNDFKVGDVITLHNDSETEYIIIGDSNIPDNLKESSEYSIDACVTVVPVNVLDSNRDYKQQIEEILSNRIKDIDKVDEDVDILASTHEHFHISLIERRNEEC